MMVTVALYRPKQFCFDRSLWHARPTVLAYKPCSQQTPAHAPQIFVVCFPYKEEVYYEENEEEDETEEENVIAEVTEVGLSYQKFGTVFRGRPAYKVVIAGAEVDVPAALAYIATRPPTLLENTKYLKEEYDRF